MNLKHLCMSVVAMGLMGAASAFAAPGDIYTDTDASVVWAMNSNNYADDITTAPEGTFSITSFDQGVCTYKGTGTTTMGGPDLIFTGFASKNGGTDIVKWILKPAKGLTFTPTAISFYIARNGTDGAGSDVTVKGQLDGQEAVTFGTCTPHRNNKTQADDKFGSREDYTIKYEYTLTPEQQAALTSGESFALVLNNGYANNKHVMYSDVQIHGKLNGTQAQVIKHSVSVAASPAEGAVVSIYPNLTEFDEGTVAKLTAVRNFGYKFINWTDATGAVASEEPQFEYTVNAPAQFTANLEVIPTYELQYGVDGGANPYQVQPSPAPTVVDGKNMYENGTNVTLTAISNPIMTFTNWSDGQSSSEITFAMDADKQITGVFSAADYVVGWDFWTTGASGRAADFISEDNDAVSLVLRDEEGNLTSWLDKSQVAAGGYEGRPGAVCWKTDGLGKWYWQTTVNATAFTNMKVIGAMTYNYNAYTRYDVEASLDEQTWTKIGTVQLEGPKAWVDYEFTLPADFNNKAAVSLRWKADKTSDKNGTTSDNDGICLGATYILGTPQLFNDGTAPALLDHVPADGVNTASINGKIVLNFDEKVKVAAGAKATLGDLTLEPTAAGKSVLVAYKNLAYATSYTFTLPAGAVMDLCDNATTAPITFTFTTRTKPEVAKKMYDFVVPDDGTLDAAIDAANNRENTTERYRIFIKNGSYKLAASKTATKTGSDGTDYPDPTVYITAPNISFIGESMDGVVITNTLPASEAGAHPLEGIGKGDVMSMTKPATDCYFQNLTIKSSMGDAHGRDIEFNDQSNRTIFKDACLWGYQDTYVSNNEQGRFYFEGGVLRGRTDFLCGKGDVFYQAVKLQMCQDGGYLAVPSVPRQYGYIFNDCEIVGETSSINGNYTLGRPWGSGTPIALYINTKMTVQPSAVGWNEMSGGWPKRFAEYNSVTAQGTPIDLKDRKKIFGEGHENNPVLTREEAEIHTLATVMGGDDDWDPAAIAEQAPQPTNVLVNADGMSWDDSNYVSLWAVVVDGKVAGFTTEPTIAFPFNGISYDGHVFALRAANEMGGLGEAVTATYGSGLASVTAEEAVSVVYYNLQGIRVASDSRGLLVKVETFANGATRTSKVIR